MSDDADAGGLVSHSELKSLAELFDAAENALEPDSQEARSAQVEFDTAVEFIYDEKITRHPKFALRGPTSIQSETANTLPSVS